MNAEYDPYALTLMHAIKKGVDPHGIMNPGTLLPPLTGEIIQNVSTIDIEKLNEWIVKPESLTASAEKDPQLLSVETKRRKSWSVQIWDEMRRWSEGMVRWAVGNEPHSHEATEENLLEVWVDQGDGV